MKLLPTIALFTILPLSVTQAQTSFRSAAADRSLIKMAPGVARTDPLRNPLTGLASAQGAQIVRGDARSGDAREQLADLAGHTLTERPGGLVQRQVLPNAGAHQVFGAPSRNDQPNAAGHSLARPGERAAADVLPVVPAAKLKLLRPGSCFSNGDVYLCNLAKSSGAMTVDPMQGTWGSVSNIVCTNNTMGTVDGMRAGDTLTIASQCTLTVSAAGGKVVINGTGSIATVTNIGGSHAANILVQIPAGPIVAVTPGNTLTISY